MRYSHEYYASWGRQGQCLGVITGMHGLHWQYAYSNGTHAMEAASISKPAFLREVQPHVLLPVMAVVCKSLHHRPGSG